MNTILINSSVTHNSKHMKRRGQANFCGPWRPHPLSRFFSNLAQRLLNIPYFNIYYFYVIMMHYNAFSAALFFRVVLDWPQNLVSFKKFLCTYGLVQLKQLATSSTATQVFHADNHE